MTQGEMVDTFGRVFAVVSAAVAGIGAISLLVGAIGILTMMWIAVGERTAEIGLLKALGATRADVRNLFLAEAALLSGVGGVAGIAVGRRPRRPRPARPAGGSVRHPAGLRRGGARHGGRRRAPRGSGAGATGRRARPGREPPRGVGRDLTRSGDAHARGSGDIRAVSNRSREPAGAGALRTEGQDGVPAGKPGGRDRPGGGSR